MRTNHHLKYKNFSFQVLLVHLFRPELNNYAIVLRGDGQCLSIKPLVPYIITLDKIANLSSISFFPAWNRYGTRGGEFKKGGYSKSVNVKVYCDDEEIFNGNLTGLVANDRVYVTFDKFNQCHLEKINVGSAAAAETTPVDAIEE